MDIGLNMEMRNWRRELHSRPEFGFEERETAHFIAAKLQEFGFEEIEEGVGRTGVVGSLTRGKSDRAIALRADMDALRITESNDFAHRSRYNGVMHACGHDGHTAMLLGAAKHLSAGDEFDGTVRFIFQPAEEWGKGASALLQDNLLGRFPFQEIYGIHNLPGLPVGHFHTRSGPLMAAEDVFEITIKGRGGHAASPHTSRDALVAACSVVVGLQTIVSRRLDPVEPSVVSVTEFIADGTRNVLPGQVNLRGDARSFSPEVSAEIERQMRVIAEGTTHAFGCKAEVKYEREFVPLINWPKATEAALKAAAAVFDGPNIDGNCSPLNASEDFARFLEHVPGCFAFIGNGDSAALHNSAYDFNDDALGFGSSYFINIVRQRLSRTY